MEKEKGNNCTSSSEFLLLGMGNIPSLHTPLFLLLLLIYLVTVVGNSLVVVLVVADQHLHSSMYFFFGYLSSVETCCSSTILPQLLASFLTGDRTISAQGCMTQLYFFIGFAASECFLLESMSYDRLKFCGPAATDNFSGFTPFLELACSDTSVVKIVTFILTLLDSVFPFLITLASYVSIIIAILRISSSMGMQKAFSTCSSNLTVVTVFYGSLIIVHMLPRTPSLRQLNKVFSFFYIILTTLVNLLTYSLQSKELRKALRKALRKDLGGTQGSCQLTWAQTTSNFYKAKYCVLQDLFRSVRP
ncbi:olfactory receptor 5B21-like [Rhea pennata]|uniref:olfactory receptor 5B21-like n=1 Tax=Rhea pennata TaxID=8795 RepID=UPI002E25A343